MIFLVNDANILIDLLKINLLTPFFQLNYEFHVTDLVFAEVREDNISDLDSFFDAGHLKLHHFSFEDLLQIQLIELKNSALSVADCSCLYLSQRLSAILLTGDGALRRIAMENDIAVHGILWVFDELVSTGLLSKGDAADKLEKLIKLNKRLPARECFKRIARWRRKA